MSLLWFGSKLSKIEFDYGEIELMYKWFVDKEFMNEDCFVEKPDAILHDLGLEIPGFLTEVDLGWEPVGKVNRIVEVLHFELPRREGGVWGHFVAGNGAAVVTYDPWGTALTVAEGVMDRRYIKYE